MDDEWYKRANHHNVDDDTFSTVGDRLFWTVLRGHADLEERKSALVRVLDEISRACQKSHDELSELIGNEHWQRRHQIAVALSDSGLAATYLRDMLGSRADGEVMLELAWSGAGRPIDWESRVDRYRDDNRAARLVERLVASGQQKSWAVSYVGARPGKEISRKRIYEGLSRRDSARAIVPDASESEIVSLIFT